MQRMTFDFEFEDSHPIPSLLQGQCVYLALVEASAAVAKHGLATRDPIRAIAILTEELGEAAEQALKATSRDPNEHCNQPVRDRLLLLQHEFAQIAGYALLQIENIQRGDTFLWIANHPATQS